MKKLFSLFAAMFAVLALNAAVINISPTSPQEADNLRLALNGAATGDTIVMAAGTYVESPSDYIAFTGKEVTVMAAEGAEVILQPKVPIRLKEGAVATFINIKFDCGHLSDVNSYENLIVPADDTEGKTVILSGCEFYGWTQVAAIIRSTTSRRLSAVTIDKCYFHDVMKSCLFLENANEVAVAITNSTFANVATSDSYSAGVIDIRATAGSLNVNQCTFYNVLAMNTDYAAVGKVKLASGAAVSNCIFAMPTEAASSVRTIRDVVAATNILVYNYTADSGYGMQSNVTKTNCVIADPLFVDAANGNFTLGEGSPALTMNDGAPIGDPRWVPAPEPQHTYTVAGAPAALFGQEWNESYAENDMEFLANQAYIWIKDSVVLSAGNIEFKVVEDHAWTNAWPEQNYKLAIPEDGYYSILIVFNLAADPDSVVEAKAIKVGDIEPIEHTYTVAGAPAALFGQEWNASYAENDMEFLANQAYMWIKDSVVLNAGTVEFKVCQDHAWAQAWPDQNYKLAIPEDGYYSIIIAFNLAADPDSIVEAKAIKVGDIEPEIAGVVYNWAKDSANQIGTTILGGNSNISIGTVKIHENTDDVDGIKFGSSYVYAEGKWIAIKPAEGGFKAGDTIYTSVVFNNSDITKYCMADVYAANGETRLFRSDSASTLNGRNAGEPIVQSYVLESDQDSLFLGRYGNTGMFITLLTVVRPGAAPEPQHTYTVAGAPATLFGQAWSASYAENDMESYGTDTYFWRRDSVALAAGNVEFKIVEDHSWSKGWPDQNYVIKIDSAGLYNITIIFKPKAEVADSMISVVVYKVGDAVVLPKIIMHGNFTGSWADTEEFAVAEDNLTASLKMNLTAGTYEFGMKFDGVWKANGAELTRANASTSLLEGNGNMKITADVDGEYIFTYTFLGEQLAVTYPAAAPAAPTIAPEAPTEAEDDVLAIYCDKYATNNLHFGISGWAGAYDVLTIDSTKIAYWKAMTWECIIDPAHTDDAHDLSGYKKLHVDFWAPAAAKIKFTVEAVAGGNYKDGVVLDLAAGWNCYDIEVALWPNNYDFKNVKCLVLEQYQTPDGASFEGNPFAVANIYFFEKEAEGIDNTAVDAKAVKSLENGILVIRKNGKAYTVTGLEIK